MSTFIKEDTPKVMRYVLEYVDKQHDEKED